MISHTTLPWTADYATHFRADGDDVLVVSFSPGEILGVPVEFVGALPFNKYANKHLFLTRVPRIQRIARQYAPDVVFATYLVSNGLSAALSWTGPLVVDAVGGDVRDPYPSGDWRGAARRFVLRCICDQATTVHAWSAELSDQLLDLGVPRSKVVEWPMGVDVEIFRPGPDAAPSNKLICTRKHEPVYDIRTILDALGMLRATNLNFSCTFVGGGHLLPEHETIASIRGLTSCVQFAGAVPKAAIAPHLSRAGVYVSASLADGTSSSLLEAMACGLLPVVSRIPANAPWIEHGKNGLLFDPGRPDELASALRRAMTDQDLRDRAAAGNRERVVRDGNIAVNLRRMSELLRSAALGQKRGAA